MSPIRARHIQIVFVVDCSALFAYYAEVAQLRIVNPLLTFLWDLTNLRKHSILYTVELSLVTFKDYNSPEYTVQASPWSRDIEGMRRIMSKLSYIGGGPRFNAIGQGLVTALDMFEAAERKADMKLIMLLTNSWPYAAPLCEYNCDFIDCFEHVLHLVHEFVSKLYFGNREKQVLFNMVSWRNIKDMKKIANIAIQHSGGDIEPSGPELFGTNQSRIPKEGESNLPSSTVVPKSFELTPSGVVLPVVNLQVNSTLTLAAQNSGGSANDQGTSNQPYNTEYVSRCTRVMREALIYINGIDMKKFGMYCRQSHPKPPKEWIEQEKARRISLQAQHQKAPGNNSTVANNTTKLGTPTLNSAPSGTISEASSSSNVLKPLYPSSGDMKSERAVKNDQTSFLYQHQHRQNNQQNRNLQQLRNIANPSPGVTPSRLLGVYQQQQLSKHSSLNNYSDEENALKKRRTALSVVNLYGSK